MSNPIRIDVDADYFFALKRDATMLQCLMDNGVDSWDGYEASVDAYRSEVGDE